MASRTLDTFLLRIALGAFCGVLGIYAYNEIKEYHQPVQFHQAHVISVKPYTISQNDSHLHMSEYRILITEDNRPIYFNENTWDTTVKEGSLVDIVAKPDFPLFTQGLTGIYIDNKK